MKCFLSLFCVLVLGCACCFGVFAADDVIGDTAGTDVTEETGSGDESSTSTNPVVNVYPEISVGVEPTPYEIHTEGTDVSLTFNMPDDSGGSSTPATYSLNPRSASSGLAAVVADIFGEYQPLTQSVEVAGEDGTVNTVVEVVPGLAGLDWEWIAGVLLFLVMLRGFLLCVGGVLK